LALVLAIAAALGVALSASAAGCGDNATQADLDVCAGDALKTSDAALNSTYRQLMDRLKADAAKRTRLIDAQKAWLAFRNAECNFVASDVVGGSIYPMIISQCADGLTRSRTRQLAAYLHCPEGDMSCPVPAP